MPSYGPGAGYLPARQPDGLGVSRKRRQGQLDFRREGAPPHTWRVALLPLPDPERRVAAEPYDDCGQRRLSHSSGWAVAEVADSARADAGTARARVQVLDLRTEVPLGSGGCVGFLVQRRRDRRGWR